MTDDSEWVSLGEAAKMLGVHPTTVRNWADQGDLPFRRTPGRHRRFNRAVLMEWATQNATSDADVPTPPERHPQQAQVIMKYALGHTRYGLGDGNIQTLDWYGQISESGIQKSREYGRLILEALMKHLQDESSEGQAFSEGRKIGEQYAKMLYAEGLSLLQVVQGFVYFNDFLIESVVQMMAPNMTAHPSEWSDMMRQINAFTSDMLVSIVRYFETKEDTRA